MVSILYLVVSAEVLVCEVLPLVVAERGEDVDDESLVGAVAAERPLDLLRGPARREPRLSSHGALRSLEFRIYVIVRFLRFSGFCQSLQKGIWHDGHED